MLSPLRQTDKQTQSKTPTPHKFITLCFASAATGGGGGRENMGWLFKERRGPEWKKGWTDQTISSFSLPPFPLLAIFGIVLLFLSITHYSDYKAQMESTMFNFHILLFILPVLLIFLVRSMSSSSSSSSSVNNGRFTFRMPRVIAAAAAGERNSNPTNGGGGGGSPPWGVAALLVVLIVMISYKSWSRSD